MERSSKRGKIPQQDWPSIMARYESGETLASIARTYDCSAPAISYVVSRSRTRNVGADPVTQRPSEPQLIKARATEMTIDGLRQSGASDGGMRASEIRPEPQVERLSAEVARIEPALLEGEDIVRSSGVRGGSPPHEGNGSTERDRAGQYQAERAGNQNLPRSPDPVGLSPQPVSGQRTLHLSLPQHNAVSDQPADNEHGHTTPNFAGRIAPHPAASPQSSAKAGNVAGGNGGPFRIGIAPQNTRDGGAFIDRALRERVDSDIAAFLTAFDTALAGDTADSRAGLREATDRLLRAGARTRIELERLEARVPLAPRDNRGPLASRER